MKGTEKIRQLNYLSKMIISSCLMDSDPNAIIYELKKDGIIYHGNSIINGNLYNKYLEMGLNIRITKYNKYIRHNKTSYYVSENDLTTKGIFKDSPDYLKNIIENILLDNNDISDYVESLDKYYSNMFFKIININNLVDTFRKYYICGENKYLNSDFKYNLFKNFNNINLIPRNYLKLFIYPLILK